LLNYLQNVIGLFKILTLTFTTFDKTSNIIFPFRKRIGINVCRVVVVILLLISLVLSLPVLLYVTQFGSMVKNETLLRMSMKIYDLNKTQTDYSIATRDLIVKHLMLPQCVEDGIENSSNSIRTFNFFMLFIQVIIPFIVITIAYSIIAFKFTKQTTDLDHNYSDTSITTSKLKNKVKNLIHRHPAFFWQNQLINDSFFILDF
jgi:hypothetical protein